MLGFWLKKLVTLLKWSWLVGSYLGLAMIAHAAAPVANNDTATIAEGSASTKGGLWRGDGPHEADK